MCITTFEHRTGYDPEKGVVRRRFGNEPYF